MTGHRAPFDDGRGAALSLIILATWAAYTLSRVWGHWPPDLSALYFAARFFAEGAWAEVYASPTGFFGEDHPQSWLDELAALGHTGEQSFPYIYPPLWAALFAPLAQSLSPTAFFNGAYIWHIALLALAPVLSFRIMRPAIGFLPFALIAAALLATSVITAHGLFQNQPQITVAVLTLLAFERLTSGHPVAAGIALGLAAAIKLTPVLFLVVLIAERQWRATAVTLGTLALLAAASLALAGPDLHVIYLEKLGIVADQLVIWGMNISLRSALFLLTEISAGRAVPVSPDTALRLAAPPWLDPITTLVLFAGGALMLLATASQEPDQRLRNRLAAWSLLLTVSAPLAWAHHYTLTLLLLPGLVGRPLGAGLALVALFGLAFANRTVAFLASILPVQAYLIPAAVALMLMFAVAFALWPRISRTRPARGRPRRT